MRTFGNPKRRWKNNIEMDLQGIGWEGLAGCCESANEPSEFY
jgi:hypothetical protein